ncbi:MAG: hypothetical protein ABJ246_00275 [Paracoccaceae bacterium]
MKTNLSNMLTFAILAFMPVPALAFDQNHFLLLVQEYQKQCGRMIATPDAFHLDPRSSFGIQGDEEFYHTEDFSNIDYYVEIALPNTNITRAHGIVSVKVAKFVEQSCQVLDTKMRPSSTDEVSLLANDIRQIFEASPQFSISGGKRDSEDFSEYFFAVTGLFSGEDIISQITVSGYELSIEHIHISSVN